jgi:hypothetical protein
MLNFWACFAWLAFCCLGSLPANAQATRDYLTPGEGYFASTAPRYEYLLKLRQVLYTGLSEYPLVRVIGAPSFGAEYVLSIEQKAAKDPHYYLVCNRAPENIFTSSSWQADEPVAPVTTQVEISPELARAIAQVVASATQQARYLPTAPSAGGDGTSFTFVSYVPGEGVRTGQTWSPSPAGSTLATLVDIIFRLQHLLTAPQDQALHHALLAEANQLRNQLAVP